MNRLIFDTETTGKANFRERPSHPSQPHLVQLGALLLDDDWKVRSEVNVIIKPDGWKIPADAARVHGITDAIANRFGVPLEMVLTLFQSLLTKADVVVAHNFEFDALVMDAAFTGAEVIGIWPEDSFCTMQAMTNVCKLPGNYGDYKWPRLSEAYQHCFGSAFDGAHDAMADVRACARVYQWIQEQKAVAA